MKTKKRILLVDDDRDFVESNKALLEAEGYEVGTAGNGMEGLQMAKSFKPDLMVLDVMMARSTEGFDVSREIPRTPELAKLPVILLTGIRKKMSLPFGFEPDDDWLPVKVVLEKPVAPDRFIAEVEKYLV